MSGSFSPSPGEVSLVNALFQQGDPEKRGILTGDVAVRLFGGAKLHPQVLGEIWATADEENNGWLSKKGTAVAVRLMGHAQRGEKINKSLISRPGPLPTIEGISAVIPQATGSALKAPPPLTPADRAKFVNMFQKAGPANGLLSGEKARDIFIKSKLPTDKLLQIWNLADTQDRGALDAVDFSIGMYFIQAVMTGSLSFIPTSLPPGLYQQASGAPPAAASTILSHSTGGSNSNFTPSPVTSSFPHRVQTHNTGQPLQPQYSGYNKPTPPQLPVRPSAGSPFGASAFAQPQPPAQWDVTPTEKASSDNFFNSLDSGRRGYIEGDVAVPFMLDSKLPEDDLALIWDLADLNNDGRLTKDGFAVAMHLIQNKLKGVPIPSSLPPTLVPPSLRQSPFSPPATQTTHQQPPASDLQDLLWDEPVQAPVPAQTTGNALSNIPAQTTGGAASMLSHQSTGGAMNVLAPQTTGPMSRQLTGQAPSPQPGSQFTSPAPRQDPFGSSYTTPSKNFLDDDDEPPAPIEDKSAEIGNVQNQLNSTNKSLETTKSERAAAEAQAANQAGQLAALQTQLSSAKAAFDSESKLLSTFKERFNNQTSEIAKVREELIRAESDLSALKIEKAEIEGTFMRDKEEHRDLNRKVIEAGQQVEATKAEVEKIKKDAKQQKGRLAIARKQLSTKEAERVKVQKELEEAKEELANGTKEAEDLESDLAKLDLVAAAPPAVPSPERALSADSVTFAASHALPGTPDLGVASPALSTKSNNPFERLALGSGPNSRSSSPFQMVSPMDASISSLPSDSELPDHTVGQDKPAPFDFAAAFEDPSPAPSLASPTVVPNGDSTPATPKANAPFAISVPEATSTPEPADKEPATFVSPTTTVSSDQFTTPPSTATPEGTPGRSMSEAVTAFPDLSVNQETPQPSTFPGAFPSEPASPSAAPVQTKDKDVEPTDLSSHLKELDIEESDSSDDDDIPLSAIAGKTKEVNGVAAAPPDMATSFGDAFTVAPTTESAAAPAKTNSTDVFGFSATHASSPFGTDDNLFETSLEPKSASPAPSPVAGADVFDEAMGISKGKTSSAPTQFSFDDAFDDSFDFGSTGSTSFTAAPAVGVNGDAPTPNGVPTAKPAPSFDDIFNASVSPMSSPAPKPDLFTTSASPETTVAPASFDAAFASFDDAPTPDLSLSQSASSAPKPPGMTPGTAPFPAGPASPTTDSSPRPSKGSVNSHPPSSPPRAISPTLQRPSTANSSKDGHEKVKEAHTRSSKLSIRLPFGRKKKDKAEPMPAPPSSLLSPPVEVPSRQASPAVDDDVEPVKQLTAMGFSRTQAVAALEKYSYDVPKALNSLLGQP